MPDKSKAEYAADLHAAGIKRKSFSKFEFCARHGISPSLYRALRLRGEGPRETRLGTRVLITADDEAAWLHERTAASAAT